MNLTTSFSLRLATVCPSFALSTSRSSNRPLKSSSESAPAAEPTMLLKTDSLERSVEGVFVVSCTLAKRCSQSIRAGSHSVRVRPIFTAHSSLLARVMRQVRTGWDVLGHNCWVKFRTQFLYRNQRFQPKNTERSGDAPLWPSLTSGEKPYSLGKPCKPLSDLTKGYDTSSRESLTSQAQ